MFNKYIPIHFIPIHFLISRGPQSPMTQDCIPILFNGIPEAPIILLLWRPPFLIMAGGRWLAGPLQIVEVLGSTT